MRYIRLISFQTFKHLRVKRQPFGWPINKRAQCLFEMAKVLNSTVPSIYSMLLMKLTHEYVKDYEDTAASWSGTIQHASTTRTEINNNNDNSATSAPPQPKRSTPNEVHSSDSPLRATTATTSIAVPLQEGQRTTSLSPQHKVSMQTSSSSGDGEFQAIRRSRNTGVSTKPNQTRPASSTPCITIRNKAASSLGWTKSEEGSNRSK